MSIEQEIKIYSLEIMHTIHIIVGATTYTLIHNVHNHPNIHHIKYITCIRHMKKNSIDAQH